MRKILRRTGSLKGEYVVYDNPREALESGISFVKWNAISYIHVGAWVTYDDGVIAQVLKVYKNKEKNRFFVFTPLNLYDTARKTTSSSFRHYQLGEPDNLRLDVIDTEKLKFAEDWLLGGLSIEASVKKNCKKFTIRKHQNKDISRSARSYGYFLISGPWFDKLLESNRLIRDRYMSIIGALNDAGVNDAYIAKKLKDAMEGLNVKERINALNQTIEMLQVDEKKHNKPISATWKTIEDNPQPPALLKPSADEVINEVLKETFSHGSPISQTEGQAPVQSGSPSEASYSRPSPSNGNASVSVEEENWERVSQPE